MDSVQINHDSESTIKIQLYQLSISISISIINGYQWYQIQLSMASGYQWQNHDTMNGLCSNMSFPKPSFPVAGSPIEKANTSYSPCMIGWFSTHDWRFPNDGIFQLETLMTIPKKNVQGPDWIRLNPTSRPPNQVFSMTLREEWLPNRAMEKPMKTGTCVQKDMIYMYDGFSNLGPACCWNVYQLLYQIWRINKRHQCVVICRTNFCPIFDSSTWGSNSSLALGQWLQQMWVTLLMP